MRGGEAGQYSPGASSVVTQMGPYSAFLYTVFHFVFYNSVIVLYYELYTVHLFGKTNLYYQLQLVYIHIYLYSLLYSECRIQFVKLGFTNTLSLGEKQHFRSRRRGDEV